MNLAFIVIYRPFRDSRTNKLEAFNEGVVLIVAYHLIVFSDFTENPKAQFEAGYSVMGWTLGHVAVNLAIMIWEGYLSMKELYTKIKK